MRKKGFTLIEVLVVISIIGLLASVILSSVTTARERARYTSAKAEIKQISELIVAAKAQTGRTAIQITGTLCSEFTCRNRGSISGLPRTDSCWTNYIAAINTLNAAADGGYKLSAVPVDPWGSPYLINQNEGEAGYPGGTCYTDTVASAGPNGTYYDTDDIIYNVTDTLCSPVVGEHLPNTNW